MAFDLKEALNDLIHPDDEKKVQRPCSNCPSDCAIAPDACEECSGYKKKLIDLLYHVEHLSAYYDRYEVTDAAVPSAGTVSCPHCGGPNRATAAVCEYCGAQLREDSGKIRVSSASEIPNPILEAQDLIFARQEIVSKYEKAREGGGLLSGLREAASALLGENDRFGERMTAEEIKVTAAAYGVSVGSYLSGLDNGVYLTKGAKAQAERETAAHEMHAHEMHGGPHRPPHGARPPFPPPPPPHHGQRPPHGPHYGQHPPQGMPHYGMRPPHGRPPERPGHGFKKGRGFPD